MISTWGVDHGHEIEKGLFTKVVKVPRSAPARPPALPGVKERVTNAGTRQYGLSSISGDKTKLKEQQKLYRAWKQESRAWTENAKKADSGQKFHEGGIRPVKYKYQKERRVGLTTRRRAPQLRAREA